MAKFSLKDIDEIRQKKKKEIQARLFKKQRVLISVHMDEEEILSGNRKVLLALKNEIEKRDLTNVALKQIAEDTKYKMKPLVEIYGPDGEVYQYNDVEESQVPGLIDECISKISEC